MPLDDSEDEEDNNGNRYSNNDKEKELYRSHDSYNDDTYE